MLIEITFKVLTGLFDSSLFVAMLKATINLPNGTAVAVEGNLHDVQTLLAFYAGSGAKPTEPRRSTPKQAHEAASASASSETSASGPIDLSKIVAEVKNGGQAEGIDKRILLAHGRLEKVLLPIYIFQIVLKGTGGLTNSDIASVTKLLGVPISVQNVSHVLSSASARPYIMHEGSKTRGNRSSLTRRGIEHLSDVIAGTKSQSTVNSD